MAAVLLIGGVLSHHTAAAIWGIRPHTGVIHVTVTGEAPRPRPGLAIHRSLSLNAAVQDGLPLTTPARALATADEILAEAGGRGGRALRAALTRRCRPLATASSASPGARSPTSRTPSSPSSRRCC